MAKPDWLSLTYREIFKKNAMTSKEFIEQQIAAGYKVHYHDGLWWEQFRPFFYKPVIPFHELIPGKVVPKFTKSFLGYKHLVSDRQLANQYWPILLLDNNKLQEYSIYSVHTPKRSQVRKGLKLTEIKRIEHIETAIEDIKNICISTRMRTKHGKPEKYYLTEEWKRWITKEFNLAKREWWGAYDGKKLIAYIYSVLIDETMFLRAAKSHTDTLEKCPNDALIFSFLIYCKNLPDCKQVSFGDAGSSNTSLYKYKLRLGFEEIHLPVYAKYHTLIYLYKKSQLYFIQKRA
ncbi:MAG: hypothetical protein RDU01_02435 [Thermodesulfovibrionales bacterium]|nr:hypothetical protein [Thermodesulfovibrionales bacterium]